MKGSRARTAQVDEEKPHCALVQPTKGHTMIQLDGTCGTEIVAGELIEGFEFEPRCLVVVIAMESEKELFNAMLSAGRILTDPFEIQVNFTMATGNDPDVKVASTNCHNSHVMLRNYELDTTGQAERDELAQVRSDITMYENLITFTKHLINSQALVGPPDAWGRVTLLSPQPSPPPPPPPVAELVDVWQPRHPPAPPEIVAGSVLVQRYEGNILDLEAREVELVLKLDACFVKDRAEGTVCGLNSNEAPDPWVARDGVKCVGYETRSAREGDYCGYCKPVAIQTLQTPCSRVPFLVAHRGVGRESDGGREEAAAGAALGRTLLLHLHRRANLRRRQPGRDHRDRPAPPRPGRKHRLPANGRLLLAQRDAHAAQRRHRRRVHDPPRPRVLVCLLQLEPHTHTHTRTHTRPVDLAPCPYAQRVQVCAPAAHRRGGQRHRAVPLQPDETHRAVPHQLRRVRRLVHQQGRARDRLSRQVLGRAARAGNAAGAALERPGPGAQTSHSTHLVCPTSTHGHPFTPQDIGFRWGAKRYDMRPANPSNSWNEKYRILVQNSVDAPYAPRNCELGTQTRSQIRRH